MADADSKHRTDADRQKGYRHRHAEALKDGQARNDELIEKGWNIHGDHLGTAMRRSATRMSAASTEQVAT